MKRAKKILIFKCDFLEDEDVVPPPTSDQQFVFEASQQNVPDEGFSFQ